MSFHSLETYQAARRGLEEAVLTSNINANDLTTAVSVSKKKEKKK